MDLFPPGRYDPEGIHDAIVHRIDAREETEAPPASAPLTLASYLAGQDLETFVQFLAVGQEMPPMPLFLSTERYIRAPLEETYQAAYRGMPAFWRVVLEGGANSA